MKKFESEFNDMMQQDNPLSPEARVAFDAAYKKIGQENQEVTTFHQRNRKMLPLLVVAAIAVLGFSLAFTPVGKAVSNFLRFGQFTSKTLKDNGFVTEQSSKANDENIDITLTEVYADQNEIGLHFTIQFPNGSKLIADTITEYSMNFALKNSDGSYLADLNTGLSAGQGTNDVISSITPEYHFDKGTNVLEATYRLQSSNGTIPGLQDTVIEINRLRGFYEVEYKPGFQEAIEGETYEEIKGYWSLPIDTSQINALENIAFLPTNPEWSQSVSGVASPSSFILTYEEDLGFDVDNAPDDIKLTATTANGNTDYHPTVITPIEQDGKKFTQIVYNYPGYDEADILTAHFKDVEIELRRQ